MLHASDLASPDVRYPTAYGHLLRERTDIWLAMTLAGLSGAVYNNRKLEPLPFAPHLRRVLRRSTQITLMTFICFASLVTYQRHISAVKPVPFNAGERVVTAGIWTLHFGLDNRLHDSQRRVSQLLKEVQVDVLGILESDLNHIVTGNRDMVSRIAEEQGYYVDMGPAPQKREQRHLGWLPKLFR